MAWHVVGIGSPASALERCRLDISLSKRYISTMERSSSSSGDELRASLAARRDLGPDYEDSLVEGFLEKMDQEIDRRVDERLAARAPAKAPAVAPSVDAGQRLALAIVSLVAGVPATIGITYSDLGESLLAFILVLLWVGIVAVNVSFVLGRRRG
ncbi:hypothetical protein ACLQ2R_32995 [Streptosporangium sp. DT93]|uniref:hypothetical protein n=1 Tax=Streptosporangium sp. DT93 TaxID=3393428 RepID=UPI003CF69786